MRIARNLRRIYRTMRVPINERPIIIYQMGKVGSSSIKYTLSKLFPDRWVTSCHILTPENFEKQAQYLTDRGVDPANPETQLLRVEGERIYQLVIQEQRKAFFITLVRDPIMFNFSRYFQNLNVFFPDVENLHELPVERLVDRFWEDMRTPSHYDWGHALRWFDQEIKPVLGIDVYEHSFPREQGYMSVANKRADLLVLKTEIPDERKTHAISEFLQIPDFEIQRANEGHQKAYADAYEAFKRQIVVPEVELNQLLDSRFMHHFYTDDEIDAIYRKWRR